MSTAAAPTPKVVAQREFWRHKGTRAHMAVELEWRDGAEVPVRIAEVRTSAECTKEALDRDDVLRWRLLTDREARELVYVANSGYQIERLELVPGAGYPFRTAEPTRHLKTRPPSKEAIERLRALESEARARVAFFSTRDLMARKAELEHELSAINDEESFRWCALDDEAMRLRRETLRPQNRRGVPLPMLEDDFPEHERIYREKRDARARGPA